MRRDTTPLPHQSSGFKVCLAKYIKKCFGFFVGGGGGALINPSFVLNLTLKRGTYSRKVKLR